MGDIDLWASPFLMIKMQRKQRIPRKAKCEEWIVAPTKEDIFIAIKKIKFTMISYDNFRKILKSIFSKILLDQPQGWFSNFLILISFCKHSFSYLNTFIFQPVII